MPMKTNVLVRIATVVGLLVTFSLLTSCQSKEEKVISQLESLCKTVEKESFDIKDVDADITFGDGTLTMYGKTGKKLKKKLELFL